jgi:hypothetical protein
MGLRAVAVVALTAALAGCSSDPAPPSTLPTLSANPSAAPTVSPLPSAVSAPTPEGAGAFARFWYSEIEAAFATKDPERVRALSAPGCAACDQFIRSVTRLRDRNERVDNYRIEVIAAETPALTDASRAEVTVVYNTDGATRYDAEGAVIRQDPARDLVEQTLVLTRSGSTWRVVEVRT